MDTTEIFNNIQALKGFVNAAIEAGEYENAKIYIDTIEQMTNQIVQIELANI